MKKYRHTVFHVTPKGNDETIWWFQGGKLLPSNKIDTTKSYQSWKRFRTQKKYLSFCEGVAQKNLPITLEVMEIRGEQERYFFEIDMEKIK